LLKRILEFVRFFRIFFSCIACGIRGAHNCGQALGHAPFRSLPPPLGGLAILHPRSKACNNNAKIGNSQPNKLPAGQQPRPTMLSCKTKAKAKVGAARRRLSWVMEGDGYAGVMGRLRRPGGSGSAPLAL